MRIRVLCNNWTGWQVLRWVLDRGERVVAVVLHPPEWSGYREEILAELRRTQEVHVSEAPELLDDHVLRAIRALDPELALRPSATCPGKARGQLAARDVLNIVDILYKRTFAPWRGAYFEEDRRRIYVTIQLEES